MRKNIQVVLKAFINGKSKNEASCSTDGTYVYSYNMKVARRHNDNTYIVIDESASPSRTTTGQIRAIQQYLGNEKIKFLVLGDIP